MIRCRTTAAAEESRSRTAVFNLACGKFFRLYKEYGLSVFNYRKSRIRLYQYGRVRVFAELTGQFFAFGKVTAAVKAKDIYM